MPTYIADRPYTIDGFTFNPTYSTDKPEEIEKLERSAWFNRRFFRADQKAEKKTTTKVQQRTEYDFQSLRSMAKEAGIQGYQKMKRRELEQVLFGVESGDDVRSTF